MYNSLEKALGRGMPGSEIHLEDALANVELACMLRDHKLHVVCVVREIEL